MHPSVREIGRLMGVWVICLSKNGRSFVMTATELIAQL